MKDKDTKKKPVGAFTVVFLVIAIVFGGYLYFKQQEVKTKRDVITLIQSKRITKHFSSGPITKSLGEYIRSYNLKTGELTVGGIASMSNVKIETNIVKITKNIFQAKVKNTKFGVEYRFVVNTITGSIEGINDSAKQLLEKNPGRNIY